MKLNTHVLLLSCFVLVTLLVSASPVVAKGSSSNWWDKRATKMIAKLTLSDEQIPLVSPLINEVFVQQDKVLKEYGLNLNSRKSPRDKPGFTAIQRMAKEIRYVTQQSSIPVVEQLSEEQRSLYVKLLKKERNYLRAKIRIKLR